MRIVLLEPEIPQNTGNIARMAAATNVELWLVGRLGFSLTDKYIRKAGMDYWDKVKLNVIPTLAEFYGRINEKTAFISTKGSKFYTDIPKDVDTIVFGSESNGLPPEIYAEHSDKLYRIPMLQGIRSLNLASSAAVITYHMLSHSGFDGLL